MTPLAHRIAKELTLPVSKRDWQLTHFQVPQMLADVHCFALDEAKPLIDQIGDTFRHTGFDGRFAFLPAPKTWLEWKGESENSEGTGVDDHAALLEERDDDSFDVTYFARHRWKGYETFYVSCLGPDKSVLPNPMSGEANEIQISKVNLPIGSSLSTEEERREVVLRQAATGVYRPTPFQIYAALALINTPRLIGRKQHMPHRGLERKLANADSIIGKFPLHAWTEIQLSVADIGTRADGSEHEAHYTGEKCLHFCRAHLRVRNGRLERVTAHWRGNPALGIKRSRYAVTA